MFDVDFDNSAPQLICHQDLRHHESEILRNLGPYFLRDHFILFSSGTTGGHLKGYALSKKALFKNAEAVNNFFGLSANDTWALSLPIYHVGGLSVLARAKLLGNTVIDLRSWEPQRWYNKMSEVTVTSVVPTQLYDLVRLQLKAPPKLRYLIVGGDFLSTKLKEKALSLGWPVIRTYGMSEVSSQLASSRVPDSDLLEVLPIHEVKTADERLLVKSESLFTLEFVMGEKFKVTHASRLCDQNGFFLTADRAELSGKTISPLGRLGDELKVGGHLINLQKLRDTLSGYLLEENCLGQAELTVEEDERKGKKLVLLYLTSLEGHLSKNEIVNRLKPVRIDEIRPIAEFKRTDLGKLKKS